MCCAFSDVRMKNREEKEKGDCAVINDNGEIKYHIEVKSAGSGFTYHEVSKTDIKYNYTYSIATHISSRYQNDNKDEKETIFIFFNNGFKEDNKRIADVDGYGFWWINVGVLKRSAKSNKDKQIKDIVSKLINHINNDFGEKNTKSNGSSFSISCNVSGITIHPRN